MINPDFATSKAKTKPRNGFVFFKWCGKRLGTRLLYGLRKCAYKMCLYENLCFGFNGLQLTPSVHFAGNRNVKGVKNEFQIGIVNV